jgi:large subunit ribosomal protein L6
MESIEIPEGVKVEIKGDRVEVKGPLGTNTRRVNSKLLAVAASEKGITVDSSIGNKKLQKKAAEAEKSFAKELKNDMEGVRRYFEARMKVVFAHFPITIEVKTGEVRIVNMIGERSARVSKIVGNTKVEAAMPDLHIYGTSKDDVGQTAANLRKTVKIRDKDCRIFQDGIYFNVE